MSGTRSVRRPKARKAAEPVGLKPPPEHPPKRLRTRGDLRALQRFMTHALVQPLAPDDRLAAEWRDGRKMADVAAEFMKPNDRLTAVERLEIYARCYWFRLIECVYDDSPGLRALLGEKKFAAFAQAYLTKYPSRSYTLRNLCSRLPQFIAEEPRWTAPHTELAYAIARFELAQTHAFDAASEPPLTPDDLAGRPPAKLRMALQPHITLLALDWPIDDYVIAVKQRDSQRAEASNTVASGRIAQRTKHIQRPRRARTYIVVHRYKHRLYYKRVSAAGFSILSAIAAGRTVAQALAAAGPSVRPEEIRESFATWMELGWFSTRPVARARG